MSDLPLADLDAFVAIAQERSFRKAARRRNVSPSSLSEAVRRLEERLDVRLLNRTTRSVTATEAGERLLEQLSPAMGEIATALAGVRSLGQGPAGRLRLNVPSIVGREILPDIICRFILKYPAIMVEIAVSDAFTDVLGEGFDAGVRYEESLHQDMIAVPIGPRTQVAMIVASPSYLASHGVPSHPRDLLQHRCIAHRFRSGRTVPWEFEKDGETIVLRPTACLVSESIEVEVAAAVQGIGVLQCFREFIAPALARGALVPVLPDWVSEFSGPFLYYASRRNVPPPLRAFVDFLREEQK